MKNLITLVLLFAGISAFAQKVDPSKVPSAVIDAFHKKFTGIKDAKWELEKENYEASFKLDRQKVSATFDKNGTWLETEKRIAANALPTEAGKYLEKNCKGKPVREACVINMANGLTNYEAQVQGVDYIFDSKGNFIKTQKD